MHDSKHFVLGLVIVTFDCETIKVCFKWDHEVGMGKAGRREWRRRRRERRGENKVRSNLLFILRLEFSHWSQSYMDHLHCFHNHLWNFLLICMVFVWSLAVTGLDVCSKHEHRWVFISFNEGVTRLHSLMYSHRQTAGNCPTYIFEQFYFCVKYEVVRYISLSFSLLLLQSEQSTNQAPHYL